MARVMKSPNMMSTTGRIPVESVDGQDVRAVHAAARAAVERARSGRGPSFLECMTYRYFGHHVGDVDRGYYRSKDEEERWKTERDPIRALGDWLVESGAAERVGLDRIDQEVEGEVAAAEEWALEAPYPDPSEVTQHVYA